MSFLFDSVDRFVAGTVGAPGERAFFIQAKSRTRLVTVALEKAQVSALAQRLEMVVKDLRKNGISSHISSETRDDAALDSPIEPEFEVGAISMTWDETQSLMIIELFEITSEDEEPENCLRVQLNLSECDAFVKRSNALINSGRPPCPFCGIPIDPQSHLCPRANGYRR